MAIMSARSNRGDFRETRMGALKASFVACSLLLLIHTLTARQQKPSTQNETGLTVTVHDLRDDGIVLISAEDPKFNTEVSQIVPAQVATVALGLKPFVAIVANGSQHTIV